MVATAQTGADQRPRLWDRLGIETKRVIWAWAFLAIPILFYVIIRFYPTIDAFWLSLTDGNIRRGPKFIGFANYVKLWSDPDFWKVFKNTFLYLLIGTPISLVVSFTIAYYLDRVRVAHGFIRALYFLPYLTTAAAMGWVWRFLYQPLPIGMINNVFDMIGIAQQPFLRSTSQALYAATVPAVWAGLGFQIIIFMAGLRAIPTSFYEAARIDGLGDWAILRKITIPLLKPTMIFLVVMSSIGFLRIFDQVQSLTANDPGGPLNATKPLVMMIYQTAFSKFQMGYASAQTVVLFLILLCISLLQIWLMRDKK